MKYYFVSDTTGKRHVIVAKDVADLNNVLGVYRTQASTIYELKPDTFVVSGFLISDK